MKPHLASAKKPSTEAGLGVRALLPAKGSAAPSRPRATRALAAGFLAAALLLALTAAPASAALSRAYKCQITALGSASSSATECSKTGPEAPGGRFGEPYGLAVDGSDNLWVTDTGHAGHGVVDKFDSSGNYAGVQTGGFKRGETIFSAAWSNAADRLFVADAFTEDLAVLNSEGHLERELTGPGGEGSFLIGADNSGGLTDGDLYLAGTQPFPHGRFTRIDANGEPAPFSATASYISGNAITGTPAGGFLAELGSGGLATDPEGNVYLIVNRAVDEFEPSGAFVRQFTGAGAPGGLGSDLSVAIDPTNQDLLVADSSNHAVDEFSSAGKFLTQLTEANGAPFGELHGIAANSSGDLYVADASNRVIDVFDPSVGLPKITYHEPSEVTETSVTLNATAEPNGGGEIEECLLEYGKTKAYGESASCSPPPPYSASTPTALSAALSGLQPNTTYHYRLLLGDKAGTREGRDETFHTHGHPTIDFQALVQPVHQLHATIRARINPSGFATTYQVEYGTEAGVYPLKTAPLAIGSSDEDQVLSAQLSGLKASTTYHYRLLAENSKGTVESGEDESFTTEAPLSIDPSSTFVSAVTATEATLNAQINPLGLATTYHFEYLTEAKYQENHESFTGAAKAPEPDAALGFTDNKDHPAAATLTGLSPETSYRYRVLATNEAAPQGIPGPTHAFATRPPGFGSLPDGRVYEAVSPVATEGHAQVFVPSAGDGFFDSNGAHGIATAYPLEVAPDGEAVIYEGDTPPTGGTSDAVYASGNAYLSTRSPGGGWNPLNINPPEATYRAFSNDLSVGVLSSKEPPSGVGPPNTDDFYAHPTAAGEGGEYRPLFTKTAEKLREPTFAGMNAGTAAVPASSHLLFQADQALLEAGPLQTELAKAVEEVLTAKQEPKALYDSVAGHPSLISVLPNGKPDASAVFGSPVTIEAAAISEALGGSHVISADGSRVFWSSVEDIDSGTSSVPKALYVRENDTQPPSALSGEECTEPAKACTVQLDAAEPGAPGPGGGARFLAASADGSRVFFTDDASAGLTKDTVSGSGQNLYEYDFGAPEGKRLTDLTAAPGADVQGVLGAGEDGSYLYFAAGGVLAKNKNGNGEEAAPQTCQPSTLCNVYLLHEGATTFIATLFGGDGIGGVIPFDLVGAGNANAGDWAATAGYRTAEVTPDGRSLVFMSGRSLTGYDNRSLDEVFLYQAGAGTISCVSCNPTGEPPLPGGILASEHNGETLGAYIPITKNDTYRPQPRVVSDDGSRVFFVSNMPLVPQDTNGAFDVYEWERDGTGSCHRAQGCVYLLSGGTEAEHSYLLGAGASGRDVFIITRDRLVPQDQNENFDVYDVREGGVPAPPEPIICTGEGCREAGAKAPAAQSPGSASFSGPEEDASHPQKPTCRKGFVKKHGHCVKQHSKKHHKKHKRANGNRGGQK